MTEENWMYTPGARSTMARLQKLGKSPAIDFSETRSGNSTVTAGWICCAFGLLCAWFFPPGHVFFGAAFILSIVGMSTHQVRQGLILLIVTTASSATCTLIMFALVGGAMITFLGALHPRLASVSPGNAPRASEDRSPRASASGPTITRPALPVATSPLTFNDLAFMVRTGLSDDEVIAAIQTRQLVEPIEASRARTLKTFGCGDKLINHLRARVIFAPTNQLQVTGTIGRANPTLPIPPLTQPSGQTDSNVIDYQEKERRIQGLKKRMESLDEDIRRIRANPGNYTYYWHYAGAGYNGIDQRQLDDYLKLLDEQRNDLRREKWRLEGR